MDEKERNSSFRSDGLLVCDNLVKKFHALNLLSSKTIDEKSQMPEMPLKFNKANFGYSSFFKSQESKQYTIINELSRSDYFGEISIMTKLPATATICVVANTI